MPGGRPKIRTIQQIQDAVDRYKDRALATGSHNAWEIDPQTIVDDLERTPTELEQHYRPVRLRGEHAGDVPVDVFVAAFERSGMTKRELALRCGWTKRPPGRKYHVGDTSRVTKTFGYKRVRRHTAEKLCEALNLDPVDCGL